MAALLVVAGLPSCGKTSAIRWLAEEASLAGRRAAVACVRCQGSEGEHGPGGPALPTRTWVSQEMCPDHYLVERFPEAIAWARGQGASLLLVETAGLCGRCSPFPERALALFVADLSMGRAAVSKIGPMLSTCDVCVLTHVDRTSWTERAMQRAMVRRHNPRCKTVALDGLTGEGRGELWRCVEPRLSSVLPEDATVGALRSRPPQFYCSFCLGQTRVDTLRP